MKAFIIIIFLLLFCRLSFPNEVAVLKKGQPAPYAGVLLDREAEDKVNVAFGSYTAQKAAMERQLDMMINLHKQTAVLEEQNGALKYELSSSTTWTKVLYFIGGALVGGIVVNK
jgi:hypothetical protein